MMYPAQLEPDDCQIQQFSMLCHHQHSNRPARARLLTALHLTVFALGLLGLLFGTATQAQQLYRYVDQNNQELWTNLPRDEEPSNPQKIKSVIAGQDHPTLLTAKSGKPATLSSRTIAQPESLSEEEQAQLDAYNERDR